MSTMMQISSHICGILNIMIILYVMQRIFRPRTDRRKSLPFALVSLVLFSICNGAVIAAGAAGFISDTHRFYLFVLFLLLFSLPFSLYALTGSCQQIVITWLYCFSTITLAYFVRLTVRALLLSESTLSGLITSNVIFYLVLLAVEELFCRISRQITLKISRSYWIVAGTIPVLISLLMYVMHLYLIHENWLDILLALMLIVLMLVSYFLFIRLAIELEHQMTLELKNQSLSLQIRQIDDMKEELELVRQARHEMKNNYFLLESLQQQGKYEELKRTLHEITHTQLEADRLVSTGNSLIDMILYAKMVEAEQNNIPFFLDVRLPETLGIHQQLLCSLINNLLDNALEASRGVCEPRISCSMHMSKGYLSILVKNRIEHSVLEKNPDLLTSKSDRRYHGVGIRLIRQIVVHCDGNLRIWEEDGYFAVHILLPDRSKQNS